MINVIVSEAIRLTAGAPECDPPDIPAAIVSVLADSLQGESLLSGVADDVPELAMSYSEAENLSTAESVPMPDMDLVSPARQEGDDTDALLAIMGFVSADTIENSEIALSRKLLSHVSITSTLESIDESVDSLRDILETELM